MSRISLFLLIVGGASFGVRDHVPRLISLSPQVSEIIFWLGKGRDLVGVSEGSDYPKEAKQKTRIGSWLSPHLFSILMFSPDWVIGDGVVGEQSLIQCQYFSFKLHSVDQLFESSRLFLKTIYGERVSHLVDDSQKKWQLFTQKNKTIKKKPTFLILASIDPWIAFSTDTFLSHALSELGGVNALSSFRFHVPYPRLVPYFLLGREIDKIYVLSWEKGAKNDDLLTQRVREMSEQFGIHVQEVILLKSEDFSRASFATLMHVMELVEMQAGRDRNHGN